MIDLEYIEIDGLLYPNVQLDDAENYNNLGKYGNLRLKYLHENQPQKYRELLFTGKLAQHCADLEQAAFEMAERIRGQYLKENPAPPEGIKRIQTFTQAQMIADEMVLHDIVYS